MCEDAGVWVSVIMLMSCESASWSLRAGYRGLCVLVCKAGSGPSPGRSRLGGVGETDGPAPELLIEEVRVGPGPPIKQLLGRHWAPARGDPLPGHGDYTTRLTDMGPPFLPLLNPPTGYC